MFFPSKDKFIEIIKKNGFEINDIGRAMFKIFDTFEDEIIISATKNTGTFVLARFMKGSFALIRDIIIGILNMGIGVSKRVLNPNTYIVTAEKLWSLAKILKYICYILCIIYIALLGINI